MNQWVERKRPVLLESSLESNPNHQALQPLKTVAKADSISPPAIIERLLIARGIAESDWKKFLEPQLKTLKDPFLLKGMDVAVERFIKAYLKSEKICIYADFDLDGTSGLALVKTCLEKFGFNFVTYFQPRRLKEGYGFHKEAVEELSQSGIDLIMTIDVGITSNAACLKAKELGLDVVLTDHHMPGDYLPEAHCIVNPNQGSCTSGLGYLSGAGVAFYVMRALRRRLVELDHSAIASPELLAIHLKNTEKIKSWDIKEVLDVFTVATLTDMVPLIEDNRVLVKHGFFSLTKTKRPALKRLIESLNLENENLSASDVSIKISPKLNALSRIDADVLPIDIYLEENKEKSDQLVAHMLETNANRGELQKHAVLEAERLLLTVDSKNFTFVFSDQFHRGVIGLVATKLSQDKNHPVFVGSLNSEGVIVGSSRQPNSNSSSLVDALKSTGTALNRSGGHYSAAGFELNVKNAKVFTSRLNDFYSCNLISQNASLEYDITASLQEMAFDFKWYNSLGPFGVGFPEPIYRLKDVLIVSEKTLSGGHRKLVLSDLAGEITFTAICFSPGVNITESIKKGQKINLLGQLQKNTFRNLTEIQIVVKDMQVSSAHGNTNESYT